MINHLCRALPLSIFAAGSVPTWLAGGDLVAILQLVSAVLGLLIGWLTTRKPIEPPKQGRS